MNQRTKENPGCIHDMQRYLSELSGLPTTTVEKMTYRDVFDTTPTGGRKCKYPSYNVNFVIDGKEVGFLTKQMRKGNIPVLTNGVKDFPYDVDIDYFLVTVRRPLADYGIPYINLGKVYKDSLGGGWYSKCELFQVNDQYFANMECTC
jgi:hypothetical protein